MTRYTFFVVLGLSLACVAPAAAQSCAEGRARVGGHCCWPGQTWSTHDRSCTGVPRCPTGLVEDGESCVAAVSATAAPPIVTPAVPPSEPEPSASADVGSAWPTLPGGRPEGVVNPRLVHRARLDVGLVVGGAVLFGLGYLGSLILSGIDGAQMRCYDHDDVGSVAIPCPTTWPISFVPLVGGLIQGVVEGGNNPNGHAENGIGYLPHTFLAAGQVVGLVMLIVGALAEVDDLESATSSASRLTFGAAGADFGLSFVQDL
jgi:hypothetical protein